jgi:bifunctional DNA-binding transcriptional regulator/antitoxin component of YhaV-PrlF toxin-antitoxin module
MAKVKRIGGAVGRRTRLSSQHQVTIPVKALHEAGLNAGDVLTVEAAGAGTIRLARVSDPLASYAGALTGVYGAGYLDRLRSEWA